MAKSFFGGFISAAAKATDRAIKQAAQERARQARAAEKERMRQEKALDKLRNHRIMENGVSYSRNLIDNPVTDAELAESKRRFEEAREENRVLKREFDDLMFLQKSGRGYEQKGYIDDAIKSYEACVTFGEKSSLMKIQHYLHSIERLAILYRKQKRYADEVRILKLALRYDLHPTPKLRLATRLGKAEESLTKNKI